METRIWYDKPDKNGTRRSKTYEAKNGAKYYVLLNREGQWAKIINAKRRNIIDTVSCTNYVRLKLAARRVLFRLGVVFEIEIKGSRSRAVKGLAY